MTAEPTSPAVSLRHLALFYRSADEYLAAISGFVRSGLAAGERVLVAVPGDKIADLRGALGKHQDSVALADMRALGRNPACIIPAVHAFMAGGGGPARFVGEPIWPGRTEAEVREATRHEALVNLAFAELDPLILCPYDAALLPDGVLADACQTHPLVAGRGGQEASAAFAGPRSVPTSCGRALPPPPPGAEVLRYGTDLRAVRGLIAQRARAASLSPARTADVVLAVDELAANTLRHAGGSGMVLVWRTPGELICEVRDSGHITDPLAGRRLPDPEQSGGHGLWLVNRSCDLTEVRTGRDGTVTRVHMRVDGGRAAPRSP